MQENNKLQQENNRAFQQMLKPAIERLAKKSPQEMAEKAGVIYEEATSSFLVKSFQKEIRVEYPSGKLSEELEEWYTLTLLHYLEMAEGVPLSGQWSVFGDLKDGLARGTNFDHSTEADFAALLKGKSPEQIQAACRKLGGEFLEGKPDLSVRFELFPRYPILWNVWYEDEEFPASGKMFVDRFADRYLTMEDSVTAGIVFIEMLKKAFA